MSPFQASFSAKPGAVPPGDVVEIGLLLPANWAAALAEMSKRRQQSIGQLLRAIIDRALADDATVTN